LPALWLFAAWLARRARREGGWARLIDADLLSALRLPGSGRSHSPWWLFAWVWTLAALALAGMTWRREETAAYRAPVDWILVLDLSPSMAATDVAPNRVTRARYVISDFLNAARDTRVALVVFAGEPHTVAPLTTDVATISALLPPLAPGIMPESGDDLAPALEEVSRLMRTVASRSPQVVVFSDGAQDPAEALRAAHELKAQGATVNVVGVGTLSGAPQPSSSGGFVEDAQGRLVLSKLQVDQLERLAAAGGGRYVPVSGSGELIRALQATGTEPARSYESASGQHLDTWVNEGVWLLPPLLIFVPLLARRGWM
jgi:Ca-activated chloride channel family protein